MKFTISMIVLLASVFALLSTRNTELSKLEQETSALRNLVKESQKLVFENKRLVEIKVDLEELKRLKAERNKLLGLRAKVTSIWTSGDRPIEDLKKEIQEAESQAGLLEEKTTVLLVAQRTKQARNVILQLFGAVRQHTENNNGRFPSSMKDLETGIRSNSESFWKHLLSRRFPASDSHENHLDKYGIERMTMDDFEFIPYPRSLTIQDRNTALLRQIRALKHPQKGWVRMYVLADGSLHQAASKDGDFSAWESRHSIR